MTVTDIRYASDVGTLEVHIDIEGIEGAGYPCQRHWCDSDATIVLTVSDYDRYIWDSNRRFTLCDDCAIELTASMGIHLPDIWSF